MLKRYKYLIAGIIVVFVSCGKDEDNNPQQSDINYKQEMRRFVQNLSLYAKNINADFIIIPQNGQELVTQNGEENGTPSIEYLNSIDGVGREDLFYGFENDNDPTPENEKNYMIAFLDICEQHGIEVLTTDYCYSHNKMDNSYQLNEEKNYISFAAPERNLNVIPDYPENPHNANSNNINTLSDAKNFLYLINPENFPTKQDFINTVSITNFDVIIMDCFFNEEEFTTQEINNLKSKQNEGKRLVISYISIGEAENYRYYWQYNWINNPPDWLEDENPNWQGNYKVRYWEKDWQEIIFGKNNSYLNKILNAGFDGAYLDIIDAFEYFEEQENNNSPH
jgi:cysteinyl-tRNA synthetase